MDGVLVTRRCVSEPRDARARRLPSRRGETKIARPLVILHSPSPSAEPQPTMTRVAPAHRSRSPPHVAPASRKTSSSITCGSSSIARGRAWCSAPTGGGARAPATSARASSRDAASGCSTGPPSTDRRTRSIARRRYSRGWTTTTRGPREETTRASPRPHPTVASPSPPRVSPPPRPGHALRRARRPRADPRAVRRGARGQAHHDARERGADARRGGRGGGGARGIGLWGTRSSHPAVGPGCSAGGDKQRRRLPHAVGGAVRRGGFSPRPTRTPSSSQHSRGSIDDGAVPMFDDGMSHEYNGACLGRERDETPTVGSFQRRRAVSRGLAPGTPSQSWERRESGASPASSDGESAGPGRRVHRRLAPRSSPHSGIVHGIVGRSVGTTPGTPPRRRPDTAASSQRGGGSRGGPGGGAGGGGGGGGGLSRTSSAASLLINCGGSWPPRVP